MDGQEQKIIGHWQRLIPNLSVLSSGASIRNHSGIVKHATARANMSTTKDKKTSKMFRVAIEGDTADGREISRDWIQQMAETYNPEKYGARIWLEHMRGIFPDGPFKAYGDVLALEARENDAGKLELFAQISPTDELVQINQQRQKIYSSIEVDPNFAKSGQAYLVGLAVTDNPSSLGTEMLQFSAQNPDASPLSARKQSPGNLFTAAQPMDLELEVAESKFTDRIKALKNKLFSTEKKAEANSNELLEAMENMVEHSVELSRVVDGLSQDMKQLEELSQVISTLKTDFAALQTSLHNTDHDTQNRPPATGSDVSPVVLTDC